MTIKYDEKTLKKVGRVLKFNRMDKLSGDEDVPNPVWNVRLFQDEIDTLLNGELPEGWSSIR